MPAIKLATFNINNVVKRLSCLLSDSQSRYLEAAAHGVIVGCLYAPNGNPPPR